MNAESYFIKSMKMQRSYIGDDAALLGNTTFSKDLFFENVHFKRKWLSPYQIGYKAMAINLSDAIAMNAQPQYALLGVAMPKSMSLHEMSELSRGLKECAKEYKTEIIGGDTISNKKLDLSVTIVAKTLKPLQRKGLKAGDWIAHTGTIGESSKQLRYLMAGGKVHSKMRFVRPLLRQKFVEKGIDALRCGMDLSDGLCSDVEKLCQMNGMGVVWHKRYPKRIRCSGEEYEMLVGIDPRKKAKIENISRLTRTPLTFVGRAVRGKMVNRCKAHHF